MTINSLDQKDYKLRDKVLEAVGEKGEEMNKEVFKRLIGEHKKLLESSRGKHPEGPSVDRKKAACWCCGENTHRRDKCPNRDKAFILQQMQHKGVL